MVTRVPAKKLIAAIALVGAVGVAGGGVAGAQCEASTAAAAACTEVAGAGQPGGGTGVGSTGVEAETVVLGVTQVRGQTLPTTGSEVGVLLGLGAGLTVAGGALVLRSRRSEAAFQA